MARSAWLKLNDDLRLASEAECASRLARELAGPRRRAWLLRIHSRLDRLRRLRERRELEEQVIER